MWGGAIAQRHPPAASKEGPPARPRGREPMAAGRRTARRSSPLLLPGEERVERLDTFRHPLGPKVAVLFPRGHHLRGGQTIGGMRMPPSPLAPLLDEIPPTR